MRLETPYTAEFDAEKQGVWSAQYPHLHTSGAPEHNITYTVEHTKKHEMFSPRQDKKYVLCCDQIPYLLLWIRSVRGQVYSLVQVP